MNKTLLKLLALFGLLFNLSASYAFEEDELLDPADAFAVSFSAADADTLIAEWSIADGYYLYHDKFSFSSNTAGVTLGEAIIPPGKVKIDEFFGEVETHRNTIQVRIPITRSASSNEPILLEARSQGCADLGVCYPPQHQQGSIEMPAVRVAVAAVDQVPDLNSALSALAALDQSVGLGGLDSAEDDFLDPDDAFRLNVEKTPDGKLLLHWKIADGYYLYQDKIKLQLLDAKGQSLSSPALSEAKSKNDQFFGVIDVYYHTADATVNIKGGDGSQGTLKAVYQGCADAGLCYPPITKTLPLDLMPIVTVANDASEPTKAVQNTTSGTVLTEPQSEQDRLADTLSSGSIWLTLLSFFGFGLLLSFTPCVFPMIPILSSIIVGQGEKLSTRRAFMLSLVYVLAMAMAYTIAGVLAGIFGANIQVAFQDPVILISFALVFVVLSLSMFGFFEIQLPASLQAKLSQVSNNQKGGGFTGVAIMGFLSALIVGPCVAPPLAGALIYIGQTGDAVLGGLALFALSMGMGAPLIAIGTSAGKLLPRAGGWMDAVKGVFGIMLLAVAIWMLERVFPVAVIMSMVGLLMIASGVYMGALEPVRQAGDTTAPSGWKKLWKSFGLALVIYGTLQFIGVASNSNNLMQPLSGLSFGGNGSASQQQEAHFTLIKSSDDLDQAIASANAQGKTVMLDFYADWCISCKELEKYTFSDPGVQAALANVVTLQADVTANDDVDKALMKRFGIIGPPSILFFGTDGVHRKGYQIVGYMPADEFKAHVEKAIK